MRGLHWHSTFKPTAAHVFSIYSLTPNFVLSESSGGNGITDLHRRTEVAATMGTQSKLYIPKANSYGGLAKHFFKVPISHSPVCHAAYGRIHCPYQSFPHRHVVPPLAERCC